MRVWEPYLTEEDKEVYQAAGFSDTIGFGERPAVLIIDVNYGFCGHRSEGLKESVKTWSHSCGESAWKAIPHIQSLLRSARKRHIPIFYSTGVDYRQDGFDAGGWRFKNHRTVESQGVPGYGYNEIVREIAPTASDVVIEKLKPSAFHGTPLMGFLNDLQVDTMLICGTTTSGCVRASVIDAFSYNFRVTVVEECTFDRGQVSHAINLFDMNAKYADVKGLEACLAYLDSLPVGLYDDKIDFSHGGKALNVRHAG